MDKIEEFIRNNRDQLDIYSPPESVWESVWNGTRRRRITTFRWLSAAAMILVVFGTAILYYVTDNKDYKSVTFSGSESMILKTSTQLRESEIYYDNLVNDLYTEAKPLLTGHPDIQQELVNDLSQIDSICADIRKDLKDNISNQEVMEALISNYRIKIRILEDMLAVLRQNENNIKKNDSHAL